MYMVVEQYATRVLGQEAILRCCGKLHKPMVGSPHKMGILSSHVLCYGREYMTKRCHHSVITKEATGCGTTSL